MKKKVTQRVEEIVDSIVKRESLELVGVTYSREQGSMVLRIYIDKEGGVTLRDCEMVSREVSAILDIEDFIEGHYLLEVSSPGIDRPLFKKEDYDRFKEKQAKIRTISPIEGRRNFSGKLKGIKGNDVIIEVDGRLFHIPFESIKKANLIGEVTF
ncbi:MAG: ribosome maturation factor RimP [Synergistetes bacterium]|nr:ribosome maturation factor RimP [Synergistota bacterium]